MKNARIANNVIMEVHTQAREMVFYWDEPSKTYAIASRWEGKMGKTIFQDDRFGVAGRRFMEEVNLDKAYLEYTDSEKERV